MDLEIEKEHSIEICAHAVCSGSSGRDTLLDGSVGKYNAFVIVYSVIPLFTMHFTSTLFHYSAILYISHVLQRPKKFIVIMTMETDLST